MVVSWHYAALGHGASMRPAAAVRPLYPVAAYGWLGVELFFLISGFVIAMSAVNRSVGEFAVSRFVRLFPAYWLGVLVTATVLLIWPIAVHPPKLSDVGVNLTMLQEGFRVPSVDAVYWTLFAELRFYLLFAFVVWRGVTYSRAVGFSVIWLAASALTYSSHGLIHTLVMPDWAPFFIAGLAFFLMHRYGQSLLLWAIVAVTFLLGQRQALSSNNFHLLGQPMPAWPVVAILAGFYLLVAAVALGWLQANWRWLTVAGVLTYPLYLLHEYIGWTLFTALRGEAADWVLLLGVVITMLGLAWLVHRYVEKPVTPWLRRTLSKGLACGADRLHRGGDDVRRTDRGALLTLARRRTGKVKIRDARSTG
jgi:peptidoglycan/LPS O-acetylase OafA/YrhL